MKKLTFLLSAVALLGLASCTEPMEVNPNYDAVKNEVKTSFTINIATQAKTKATATEVQIGQPFRGMSNMSLFAITGKPEGNVNFTQDNVYNLGSIGSGEISDSQSSKVYNLAFPVGIDNMVFYARAQESTTELDMTKYGVLDYTVSDKANTKFGLKFITDQPATDGTKGDQFGWRSTCLAAIVNDVMSEAVWNPITSLTEVAAQPLKEAFHELTTIRSGEFRAGSGAAVVRLLNDLRDMANVAVSNPLSSAALVTAAQALADKISIYVSTEGEKSFKNMGTLKTLGVFVSDATVAAAADHLTTGDLRNFPRKLGLPSGAAQFTYDATNKKFIYVTSPESFGSATTPAAVASVAKFALPAELTYWVSSPIRVSDNETIETADYPKTVATWAAEDWGTKWPVSGINGKVLSSTRAVALQNNINYGVALLQTKVNYKAATITDNRKAILDRRASETGGTNTETDMVINVTDGMFQLKGVLVGGQPDKVGWNWIPTSDATFNNVVYDRWLSGSGTPADDNMQVSIPAGGMTTPVYTMVLDNYQAGADKQDVVYVALELVNNTGKDFYGRDNLVRNGGIFYMVGKLDLSALTAAQLNAIEYPANTDGNGYRFPPMNASSVNEKVIRVFMQDYVTTANFTITNLHGAYVTVPDLRSIEMTFGLSVDLAWKAGASFDIELK